KVWDSQLKTELLSLQAHPRGGDSVMWHCAYSGDGKRFVTVGARDNKVKVWNAATGQEIATIPFKDQTSWGFAELSHDGTQLILAEPTPGAEIEVLDVDTKQVAFTLKTQDPRRTTVAVMYSPDGNSIATLHSMASVTLWDVKQRREKWTYRGAQSDQVNQIA